MLIWKKGTITNKKRITKKDRKMSSPFKLLCWNVDQARREESDPRTCWNARSARVKKLIHSCEADIVALLELRDLKTSGENVQQFIACFPQYTSITRRYCQYAESFSMCLLVNQEKFFVGDTRIHNYHNTPNNDKMVMFVDLLHRSMNKWITIGLTHFDMDEEKKWVECAKLGELIETQKYPTIVYGDYNFFDDLPHQGIKQRNYMLNLCNDLVHPLHDDQGEILSGTFLGFAHDEFKQHRDSMSKLDHAFVPKKDENVFILHTPTVSPNLSQFSLDNSSNDTYEYPSDHLAIQLTLRLRGMHEK